MPRMTNAKTAPVLDSADAFETKLRWILFKLEQEKVLYSPWMGRKKDEWNPGDYLHRRPDAGVPRTVYWTDSSGELHEAQGSGGYIRPMFQLYHMGTERALVSAQSLKIDSSQHCEACDVMWMPWEDPCWFCGEPGVRVAVKKWIGEINPGVFFGNRGLRVTMVNEPYDRLYAERDVEITQRLLRPALPSEVVPTPNLLRLIGQPDGRLTRIDFDENNRRYIIHYEMPPNIDGHTQARFVMDEQLMLSMPSEILREIRNWIMGFGEGQLHASERFQGGPFDGDTYVEEPLADWERAILEVPEPLSADERAILEVPEPLSADERAEMMGDGDS